MTLSEGGSRSGGRPCALVWSPIPLITWLMPFIGHLGVCSSSGRTFDFAGPFTVNEDCLLFGRPTRYLVLDPAQTSRGGRSSGTASREDLTDGPAGRARDEQLDERDCEAAAASGAAAAPQAHGSGWSGKHPAGRPGGVAAAAGGGGMGTAAMAADAWDRKLCFAATTYRLLDYNIMTRNCHCFVAHFLNQAGYKGGSWNTVNLAALMFVRSRFASPAGFLYTWLPWALLVGLGSYFGQLLFLYIYLGVCAPLLAWFLFYTWCCWRDLSF